MNSESNWFATEAGQALVEQSMEQANTWLWPICGHNALVIQPSMPIKLRPQLQCMPAVYLQHCNKQMMGDFVADDDCIPLVSECMAMVYAQFVMEENENRVEILHEFERVLVSEGHLALFCLNPYGIYHLTGQWRGVKMRSLQYWANLLHQTGFEICHSETIGPYWPSKTNSSSDKIMKPFNGFRSVNFILARKRKSALTPLRNSAGNVALAREPF